MKSLYKRTVSSLSFIVLLCIPSLVNAEESESGKAAQSSVAPQGAQESSKEAAAKSPKTDEAKKKSSSEPEPECNN